MILSREINSRNGRPFDRDDRTRRRLGTERASSVPRGPPEAPWRGWSGEEVPTLAHAKRASYRPKAMLWRGAPIG